jgi:hypothetical protein
MNFRLPFALGRRNGRSKRGYKLQRKRGGSENLVPNWKNWRRLVTRPTAMKFFERFDLGANSAKPVSKV